MSTNQWIAAVVFAFVFAGLGGFFAGDAGTEREGSTNDGSGTPLTALVSEADDESTTEKSLERLDRRLGRVERSIERVLDELALIQKQRQETGPAQTHEEPQSTAVSGRLDLTAVVELESARAMDISNGVEPLYGTRRFDEKMVVYGLQSLFITLVVEDIPEALDAVVDFNIDMIEDGGPKMSPAQRDSLRNVVRAYWSKIVVLQARSKRLAQFLRDQSHGTDDERDEWTAKRRHVDTLIQQMITTYTVRVRDVIAGVDAPGGPR